MTVTEKVIGIIGEMLQISRDDIKEEDLISDLAHDSIKLFELFIRFEKEIGEPLSYEDVMHIETVGDVIAFATKKGYFTEVSTTQLGATAQ